MNESRIGCESLVIWRFIYLVRILKVGEVDVGFKFFFSRGEVGSLEILFDCLLLCWVGVYGEEGF